MYRTLTLKSWQYFELPHSSLFGHEGLPSRLAAYPLGGKPHNSLDQQPLIEKEKKCQ